MPDPLLLGEKSDIAVLLILLIVCKLLQLLFTRPLGARLALTEASFVCIRIPDTSLEARAIWVFYYSQYVTRFLKLR
jgi:hypothetical protein